MPFTAFITIILFRQSCSSVRNSCQSLTGNIEGAISSKAMPRNTVLHPIQALNAFYR